MDKVLEKPVAVLRGQVDEGVVLAASEDFRYGGLLSVL